MPGFKLAVCNLQFVKNFSSLQMNFCNFLKIAIHENQTLYEFSELFTELSIYIISYSNKPIKYPLLNNNSKKAVELIASACS